MMSIAFNVSAADARLEVDKTTVESGGQIKVTPRGFIGGYYMYPSLDCKNYQILNSEFNSGGGDPINRLEGSASVYVGENRSGKDVKCTITYDGVPDEVAKDKYGSKEVSASVEITVKAHVEKKSEKEESKKEESPTPNYIQFRLDTNSEKKLRENEAENGKAFTFRVTTTQPLPKNISHKYKYKITGIEENDINQKLIGEFTSDVIKISPKDDTKIEPDETFTITLTSVPDGLSRGVVSASAIILNDDKENCLTTTGSGNTLACTACVSKFTILEGNCVEPVFVGLADKIISKEEGADGKITKYSFPLIFEGFPRREGKSTTITYDIKGAGLKATDFEGDKLSGIELTLPGTADSANIDIGVVDNKIVESDKNFEVVITKLSAGVLPKESGKAKGVILNDDSYGVSINNPITDHILEDSGRTFSFPVMLLNGTSNKSFDIPYTISGDGITEDDFEGGLKGTVGMKAGQNSATLSLKVQEDKDIEGDEVFTVTINEEELKNLANSENKIDIGFIQNKSAKGTIVNDDDRPIAKKTCEAPTGFLCSDGKTCKESENDCFSVYQIKILGEPIRIVESGQRLDLIIREEAGRGKLTRTAECENLIAGEILGSGEGVYWHAPVNTTGKIETCLLTYKGIYDRKGIPDVMEAYYKEAETSITIKVKKGVDIKKVVSISLKEKQTEFREGTDETITFTVPLSCPKEYPAECTMSTCAKNKASCPANLTEAETTIDVPYTITGVGTEDIEESLTGKLKFGANKASIDIPLTIKDDKAAEAYKEELKVELGIPSNGVTLVEDKKTAIATIIDDDVVNKVPVAQDDRPTLSADSESTVIKVLDNDTDPDKDKLTVTAINKSNVKGFLLLGKNDGVISYDPNNKFNELEKGKTATDTFSYTVSDGKGGEAKAKVTITIEGIKEVVTNLTGGEIRGITDLVESGSSHKVTTSNWKGLEIDSNPTHKWSLSCASSLVFDEIKATETAGDLENWKAPVNNTDQQQSCTMSVEIVAQKNGAKGTAKKGFKVKPAETKKQESTVKALACSNNDDCNGSGICEDGTCFCYPGFTGEKCETKSCPSDCSGHGECSDGRCTCNEGFTGSDCSIKATNTAASITSSTPAKTTETNTVKKIVSIKPEKTEYKQGVDTEIVFTVSLSCPVGTKECPGSANLCSNSVSDCPGGPFGGTISVSPTSVTALTDQVVATASGWRSIGARGRLKYTWFHNCGGAGKQIVGNTSLSPNAKFLTPYSGSTEITCEVTVDVEDEYGRTTSKSTEITVKPVTAASASMASKNIESLIMEAEKKGTKEADIQNLLNILNKIQNSPGTSSN